MQNKAIKGWCLSNSYTIIRTQVACAKNLDSSSWSALQKEEIEPETFTLNTSSQILRRSILLSRFSKNGI